jgi:hypothetical protein
MKFITMGFWLPVGKANFFTYDDHQELKDKKMSVFSEKNDEKRTRSVSKRIALHLTKLGFKYGEFVFPPNNSEYNNDINPYAVYFFKDKLINGIDSLFIRVDSDGFYLFVARISESGDSLNLYNLLSSYIVNDIVGGDFFSQKEEEDFDGKDIISIKKYLKSPCGILNFFQLNLLLGGLFNYNFNSDYYFNPLTNKNVPREEYKLRNLFNKIICHPELFDEQLIEDNFNKNIKLLFDGFADQKDDEKRKRVYNFEQLFCDTNGGGDCFKNKKTVSFFGKEFIRQFVKNTATSYLLPLKWNIENCRRSLLRVDIGILHRPEQIEQLENPFDNSIKNKNQTQIKGYILLISSKLPLIKNIEIYLKDIIDNSSKIDGITREYVSHWKRVVDGIENNIISIENAITQSRLEKMLFELEELRSEQEAQTEITRSKEYIHWEYDDDNSESNRLSANSVFLGITAFVLTLIIYFNNIFAFFVGGSPTDFHYTFLFLDFYDNSTRVFFLVVSVILLWLFINQITESLNRLRRVIIKYWPWYAERESIKKTDKYQYELDARIDLLLERKKIKYLLNVDGGGSLFPKKGEYFGTAQKRFIHKITKSEQYSYRTERISEEESIHKISYLLGVDWNKRKEMKSHVIYEILTRRKRKEDGVENSDYFLREFRFIGTNKGKLNHEELNTLKQFIINSLLNEFLEIKIEESDSVFSLININKYQSK